MKLYHIVCMDRNRAIGRGGTIPFNNSLDKKRFKQITSGGVLVMGRKTFEDIGAPLNGRTTIVLSHDMDWCQGQMDQWGSVLDGKTGLHCCTSFKAALDYCEENELVEIYIAGGQELYTRTLPYISEIRATVLDLEVLEPDRFYPEIPRQMFFQIWSKEFEGGVFSDSAPVYANKDLSRIDF